MNYNSIIVVGSSGAGKTTVVNSVRGPGHETGLLIPKRYITRAARHGDDMTENGHMTHEAFDAEVLAGHINPNWSRDLGGDKLESYGFQRADNKDERMRLYSANNAFMRSTNESVLKVLETGLVVLVHAAREERERRLFGRSPDIAQVERDKRLSDGAEDILALAGVHVIDTTDLDSAQTELAFLTIVGEVLANEYSINR